MRCNHLSMILSQINYASRKQSPDKYHLTHWGRVMHICVGNLTIIGSDNDLSPGRLQAIIWTNAGILLIGPLGTNFSEIQIRIETFSYKKMHLKMSSVKWCLFCLGLNVLKHYLPAPITQRQHPTDMQRRNLILMAYCSQSSSNGIALM